MVICSKRFLLIVSICYSAALFASHFTHTFISVFWISDDFESFCLWNHCDIIPLHYLSLPSPEFMHGNCLPIFQGLITLQSLHSPDKSSFQETRLCPLNLTISSYSTYLNSDFYFWPFLLTGLIETHRNCITEPCVRIRVEIFYW